MNLIIGLLPFVFVTIGFLINNPINCKDNSPEQDHHVVSVTNGKIRGKVALSRFNRTFLEFLGIPYADVPKRFEVAAPPKNWKGVREAQNHRNACAQIVPGTVEIVGSEDCLYLNVFTPKLENSPSRKLIAPVLVFFSDENFQTSGKPDSYGPEYFMDEDVVLITLGYRLGAFGFLTLGDEEVLPGNLALKDQVLALKWIQANVHVFGGDRSRVTLFGSGSGSIAVSLHLLSPMSSGLFSSVISTSGTFSCPNTIILDPSNVAHKFAQQLNCSYNSSQELASCLEKRNATEILLAQDKITGWTNFELVTPFGPTIESPSPERVKMFKLTRNAGNVEENLFLPDFPENLVQADNTKAAPWIVGINSKPGYHRSLDALKNNSTYLELLNTEWLTIAPLLFQYSSTSSSQFNITKKIREFYFYNEDIDVGNLNHLYTALSDQNFFQCVKRSALLYGASAPVFLYYFTYLRHMQMPELNGVGYMAELQYFFKLQPFEYQISPRSGAVGFSKNVVRLWTSFAKHGTPKETWPRKDNWSPISDLQVKGEVPLRWFRIDSELSSIREPFYSRVKLWSSLPTRDKLYEAQARLWTERRRAADVDSSLITAASMQTIVSSSLCVKLHLAILLILYNFL